MEKIKQSNNNQLTKKLDDTINRLLTNSTVISFVLMVCAYAGYFPSYLDLLYKLWAFSFTGLVSIVAVDYYFEGSTKTLPMKFKIFIVLISAIFGSLSLKFTFFILVTLINLKACYQYFMKSK